MAKRKPKKPPRPKLRKWFPARGPAWLNLEPAGLAMVGGLFFTTCTMVFYLVRHLAGAAMELQDILAGIALTFFASYTGTGFFVWYMLYLAERELDKSEPAARSQRAHESEAEAPAETAPAAEATPANESEPPEIEDTP